MIFINSIFEVIGLFFKLNSLLIDKVLRYFYNFSPIFNKSSTLTKKHIKINMQIKPIFYKQFKKKNNGLIFSSI